jgi:hypothetical protein
MGYQHHPYEQKKHRYAKRTNLQYSGDAQDMSDRAYDRSFPNRALRSWERAELRDYCQAHNLPEPQEMTLSAYIRTLGHPPEVLEGGQWQPA